MIIGNNKPNPTSQFQERFHLIKEQAKNNHHKINAVDPSNIKKQQDVTNRNDMADKSIAFLQERLNNGLISLEEFNQKVRKINQSRQ